MAFFTQLMDSRGTVSPAQLQQDTSLMTFGIELECIAVFPPDLFENDERNYHADAISALSLACMKRGINSSGHESVDDDEVWGDDIGDTYSRWCFKDEGGLYLSKKEREALPDVLDNYTIEALEVSSRCFNFEGDDWQKELRLVLDAFHELEARGVLFVTNATTGYHIHVGFGQMVMPLRTAKSVLQLCTGFEDRLDALYSTSRIDENAATNVAPGRHFNAGLAWHFKNNERTDYGPNIFHWLTSIEEASSFEQLGDFFRNDIPEQTNWTEVEQTNAHFSTLNLDNLYEGLHGDIGSTAPTGTIEFRQHGGTLDLATIVAHILLKQALVEFCHTSTDKKFLQLFAHISNPTFRLSDLIGAIGGSQQLLEYHESRRSFATAQAQKAAYEQTMAEIKDGWFDDCPLNMLENQASVEHYERNNWAAVSAKIQAKHQAGAYGQIQTRDLDIAVEWNKFVWFNSSEFPADELATLTRVMVFQQLNGDDMEFDCSPRMSGADEDMEDVESDGGDLVYSADEMME